MAVILLYNTLSLLLLPVWVVILLMRLAKGKEDIKYIAERFIPKYKNNGDNIIWIHAASVGEGNLALNFIDGLQSRGAADTRFIITCMTLAARKVIEKKLPARCNVQLIPVDNLIFVEIFLARYKPKLAVFMEAEFWPCIISRSARRCNMLLLNARMSDRSFARWSKLPRVINSVVSKFSEIVCQSERDQTKFKSLGLKNIKNFGNLKFANKPLKVNEEKLEKLQKILAGKDIIVCASTHRSDEEILLPTIQDLKKTFKSAYFIIVPRHISRKSELDIFFKNNAFSFSFASDGALPSAEEDMFIVDRMGELGTYYKLCSIAFVGGSCARTGGHSPIEPAMFGKPILTGPDTSNFSDVTNTMKNQQALRQASVAQELKTLISKLLKDKDIRDNMGKAARSFADSQKSELEQYFSLTAKYINI